MIMKLPLISILFISISLSDSSNAEIETDTGIGVFTVAKCGYNCWPKYGAESEQDLNVHRTQVELSANNLDDYQIGELRGCMEECLINERDTDFYPPLEIPATQPSG